MAVEVHKYQETQGWEPNTFPDIRTLENYVLFKSGGKKDTHATVTYEVHIGLKCFFQKGSGFQVSFSITQSPTNF